MNTLKLSKPNILVVGPSGSGKSSSYENFPSESTLIIDAEGKGFPFRKVFPSIVTTTSYAEAKAELEKAKLSPQIKYIIIDSFTKITEQLLTLARLTKTGYDIYGMLGVKIREFLDSCKSFDKTIILIGIDEVIEIIQGDGGKKSAKRCFVNGREHEGKIEKEFLLVLFTELIPSKKIPGAMEYMFRTNSDGVCSAKTPAGMFPADKELLIPNDLWAVVQRMEKYYNTLTV